MNDPWTWTAGWGLALGVELGRGEQRGKNWDNSTRTTIKILKIKILACLVTVNFELLIVDILISATTSMT